MAELIITAINVFILSFAIGYILSPMITKMLGKRKAQIAQNISDARKSREDALLSASAYEERLANFEQERESVLDRAKAKANAARADILSQANAEAGRIIERANKEAALVRAKVKDDIKRDMVTYAAAAASKLIAENMDARKQDELIDATLKEMGEATWQN